MLRKWIAGILAMLMLLAFAGCGKKEPGDDEGSIDESKYTEGKYNFLVMGHDRAANLTDVNLLISFDTSSGGLTVMQIPRDTFVDYGASHYKLNSMYSTCYNEARGNGDNAELEAAQAVAKNLEETLCVKIHYTAVMDLDGFASIVDAVGGVTMDVPSRMEYPDEAQGLYIDLQPGVQTLDGNTAEQFVRYRSGYANGDIGRGDAQKLFMTAFIQAVKSNLSISSLSDIAKSITTHLDTDLTVEDIVYFGKKALSIDLSSVTMMTLPGKAVTSANSGASYYVMNRESAINVIDTYYNIYDFAITDEIFDRNCDFCNTTDAAMETAYYLTAEEITLNSHSAQDISEGSIKIPMKK